MGLRSSPLAYTILPSSAGGLGLFQSDVPGVVGSRKNFRSYTETSIIPRLTEQPLYFNDFLR